MASRLVVLCNSVEGLEEEFDRWYDEIHLPQTVQLLPGVTRGQKFRQAVFEQVTEAPYRYLVIYEIDDHLLEATVAQFLDNRRERAAAIAEGRVSELAVSPALASGALMGFFTSASEPVTKDVPAS